MAAPTPVSGTIIGYDPGGNEAHGLAVVKVDAGEPRELKTCTAGSLAEAISFLESLPDVLALGIDTLTCWATGPGGWRPADLWLRERYPAVAGSVVSPNYLSGAMGLNGMGFLLAAKDKWPRLSVTETHPKILLFHLTGAKHDYAGRRPGMVSVLERSLGCGVSPKNDHEWDAALSAFAALEGFEGRWRRDLHDLPLGGCCQLVWPAGRTGYYWPT